MDSFGPDWGKRPDALDWLAAVLVTALVFGGLAYLVVRVGGG